MKLKLALLEETFAVCRLPAGSAIPDWAVTGSFFSVTKTADELSVVCHQATVPGNVAVERDWRAFRVAGTLDFTLTGILASIANPLAAARISIFAISTFDTDYVLVKAVDLENARLALGKAGLILG